MTKTLRMLLAAVLTLVSSGAMAEVTIVHTVRTNPPANILQMMRDFDQGVVFTLQVVDGLALSSNGAQTYVQFVPPAIKPGEHIEILKMNIVR